MRFVRSADVIRLLRGKAEDLHFSKTLKKIWCRSVLSFSKKTKKQLNSDALYSEKITSTKPKATLITSKGSKKKLFKIVVNLQMVAA